MTLLHHLKRHPLDSLILERNPKSVHRSETRTIYVPGDPNKNIKYIPLVVVLNDHYSYLEIIESLNERPFSSDSRAFFRSTVQSERYRIQMFHDLDNFTGLLMRGSIYKEDESLPPLRWVPGIEYGAQTTEWLN